MDLKLEKLTSKTVATKGGRNPKTQAVRRECTSLWKQHSPTCRPERRDVSARLQKYICQKYICMDGTRQCSTSGRPERPIVPMYLCPSTKVSATERFRTFLL